MDIKIRYQGKNVHRFDQNPLEKVFAKRWQELCEYGQIEYLLSGPINQRLPITDKEQIAANTVVQWLGSPVGQAFLCTVVRTKEAEEFLRYLIGDEIIKTKLKKLL